MSVERDIDRHADMLGRDAALADRAVEDGLDPYDDDFDEEQYLEDLWVEHFEPDDDDIARNRR